MCCSPRGREGSDVTKRRREQQIGLFMFSSQVSCQICNHKNFFLFCGLSVHFLHSAAVAIHFKVFFFFLNCVRKTIALNLPS